MQNKNGSKSSKIISSANFNDDENKLDVEQEDLLAKSSLSEA
jgi:hypothetical protein